MVVPHLSIIVPACNESTRIGGTLDAMRAYLDDQAYTAGVVVVDDGSTDGTADLVRRAHPWAEVISYAPNRGKGHAVREGMMAAHGRYRLFYDADGSTPIAEVEKLWPRFEAGADIVIGSRSVPDSEVVVHQAAYREKMGRLFNAALRLLGLTRFPDTQCGFKAFTAEACERVFARQTVEGFAFDAELLAIAQCQGLRIEQVGVRWVNAPRSSVNPVTDAARMLAEAWRIRANLRAGRYD
jgi:dolichyl-phosphate beta-glucosyltransferase